MLSRLVLNAIALASGIVIAAPAQSAPMQKGSGFIIPQMTAEAGMVVDLGSIEQRAGGMTVTTHALSPSGKARDIPGIGSVDDIRARVEIDCAAKRLRIVGTSAYRDGHSVLVAPPRPNAPWQGADATWLEPLNVLCGEDTRQPLRLKSLADAREAYTQALTSRR